MSSEIYQTIILALTLAGSYLLINSHLGKYELQATSLIFIIYFVLKKNLSQERKQFFNAIFFTFVISNTINSTGGLESPFFFLNYFLIFSASLLLAPTVSLSLACILVIFFILQSPFEKNSHQLITLISLPFLTPFAVFLGKEYQKVLEQKKLIKILRSEKEDSFLFLSLVIKKHISKIKEMARDFKDQKDFLKIEKVTRRMDKLIDQYEKDI